MVFCRTRRRAGWVAAALRKHEVRTVLIHGDRSQRQRQEALDAFAGGRADVVVATDVASRGLHVPAARCVINYDVPLLPEEYVHRVGRAGHGGGTAEAWTLRCPADIDRWVQVAKTMRVDLTPERAPSHAAYLRTRDGFAPDAEDAGPREVRAGKPTKTRRAKSGTPEPKVPGGRTLASMIRNAPVAVKRKKDRLRQGAKTTTVANPRGQQRRAPIAKGQRPGGGVRKST
jgi:ATP-dependent RNA helicase RhlE